MNWTRLVLDALLMAAVFNLAAMAAMAYDPRLILPGYPKSIREPAPPTAREKRLYNKGMIFGMLALTVYSIWSALSVGVAGFWNLFFTFYLEWLIVSLSDFFLLDILLMKKWGARIVIPGTEGHPDYEFKNWMKKLALPEHLLLWPFLLAPLLALVQAGVGWLIG